MDLYTIIGLAGAAAYIASYALLQLGHLDGNGLSYSVANVAAACLMLISLTDQFHLGAAVIQIIWIVVGVAGLVLRGLHRRASIAPALATQAELDEDARVRQDQALEAVSPFRAAPQSPRTSYGLRPDTPHNDRQSTLGLRADVLASYQTAQR